MKTIRRRACQAVRDVLGRWAAVALIGPRQAGSRGRRTGHSASLDLLEQSGEGLAGQDEFLSHVRRGED